MLRNSISSTRKFFQRTIGSLKSIFSGSSYEKLPKSPPNKSFSGSATTAGFDNNCAMQKMSCQGESTNKAHKVSANGSTNSTKKITSKTTKQDHIAHDFHSSATNIISTKTNPEKSKMIIKKKIDAEAYRNKVMIVKRPKEDNFSHANNGEEEHSKGMGEMKNYVLVEQKLKELELLDMSNVDHVLDIEEVLHYYSRLTCPAYLQIVDNFFMEIFAEFFGSNSMPAGLSMPKI